MRQEAQIKARAAALWQFLNGTEGEFRERVLRSGFWVVASSIGIRMVEFTRSIILARLLLPEVFGLMGIAAFILSGLDATTQTGYGAALIHRQEKAEEAYDTSWVIAMVRGVALAALVALAAPWVASFYDQPRLTSIIRVVALSPLIFGFQNVNMVRFRRDLDFKRLAVLQQGVTLFGAVVVVGLAWWLRSVWALVIGNLISALITVALSFAVQRQWPRPRFRIDIARELYRYGKFVAAGSVVIFLSLQLDNAIVGKLIGMQALGYYLLAYSLANLPATHITYVLSDVMFPSYSRIQADPERLRALYLKVLKATAMLTIPAAAGMAFLAGDLTRTVYGQKWLPMVVALQILCVHGGLRSLTAVNGPLYLAIGKPNIPFYINSLRIAAIVAFIFPLASAMGIEGASIAVSLAIGAQLLLSWWLICGLLEMRLRDIFQSLMLSATAAAGMVGGLFVVGRAVGLSALGLQGLLAQVGLGVALYAGCLLALDRDLLGRVKGFKWSVAE